jgi:hypothetical protein
MLRGKQSLAKIPSAIQRYGLDVLSVALALGMALILARYNFRGAEFPLFLMAIALTVWYAARRGVRVLYPCTLTPVVSTAAWSSAQPVI